MKLILFFVISCLALNSGKGAPRTAVYKFVRCNPEGDQTNCVTQQSPEMTWSPDLPIKLPSSAAQYLGAQPVEDESPLMEDEEEEEEEEESQMTSEDRELSFMPEEGSGMYEGSAEDSFIADQATAAEMGSGEYGEEAKPLKGGREDMKAMRLLFPSRSLSDVSKPAEQELKEDHLLQL